MMHRFRWASAGLLCAFVLSAQAETVTFTRDVLPILQENCQECHRAAGNNFSGMVAPMSLVTYDEVRPWARAIAKQVSTGKMPPWYASDEFNGVFELERGLTEAEIDTLVKWAETGARRGRPDDAPPPLEFPVSNGWTMGEEPDLILELPEPYWVADDVYDIQPTFETILTEEQLPEDRWIHWIEFHPDSSVVHHGGARVQPLDENGEPYADPISGGKIIGTAQGDGPDVWPQGYGKLIRTGSKVVWNIHYHKEPGPGTGVWDNSKIGIKWHTDAVEYVVRSAGISSRGWEVPPYTRDWLVGAAWEFEEDTFIINMMPHMHWRGQAARYDVVYPDGTRETLLDVPTYDFQWQMTYTYKEPKFLPAGTRMEVSMWFDNSPENPYNEAPHEAVGFGSMSADEMNIGWVEYANAHPIKDIAKHDFGTRGTGVEDLEAEFLE